MNDRQELNSANRTNSEQADRKAQGVVATGFCIGVLLCFVHGIAAVAWLVGWFTCLFAVAILEKERRRG